MIALLGDESGGGERGRGRGEGEGEGEGRGARGGSRRQAAVSMPQVLFSQMSGRRVPMPRWVLMEAYRAVPVRFLFSR